MGAYTDDVLFIHIPKCGGTAVKRYMLDHLQDVRWPRTDTWFWKERGLIERDPTPEDEQAANESVQRSRLPIGPAGST